MKLLGDIVGIAVVGVALAAIARFVPESQLNPMLLPFIFLGMAVSGIWIWRRKPALSPRQWAGMLAVTTLGFLIIGGAVVAYAYMRGARGTFADVVWASSIGAVASYGVPLGLLALGGYVRALIVRRRL